MSATTYALIGNSTDAHITAIYDTDYIIWNIITFDEEGYDESAINASEGIN